jgi:hypothetical protein
MDMDYTNTVGSHGYRQRTSHLLPEVDVLADNLEECGFPEVQDFCWLAKRHRLPTNERRFRHLLTTSDACPSCTQAEDTDHLLLQCSRAREVWSVFFPQLRSFPSSFEEVWAQRCHSSEESTICTAIAWNVWKRRNALVFNAMDESLSTVVRRCIEDVRLWAYRCTTPSSSSLLDS